MRPVDGILPATGRFSLGLTNDNRMTFEEILHHLKASEKVERGGWGRVELYVKGTMTGKVDSYFLIVAKVKATQCLRRLFVIYWPRIG